MTVPRKRPEPRRLTPTMLISLFSLGANAGGSRATLELSSRLRSDVTYLVADPADGLATPLLANPAGLRPPTIRVNRLKPKPHVRPGTASARELLRRNLDLAADFAWVRRQDRLAAASGAELVCSMTTLMHRADVFWVHFLRAQAVEQTYGVSVSRADALLRRIDLKERPFSVGCGTAVDPRVPFMMSILGARRRRPRTGRRRRVHAADGGRSAGRPALPSDDVLALFVGRSPERKGLEPLVESAARIRRTAQGHRLRLAFAGFADTDYAHRVLAGHSLGAFVPGELAQDVLHRDWYSAADLLILPSMVEPFGLVALEAMSCGVPAAVSDVAGAAEVISDRETGVVLDSRHLAADLDRLLVDALEGRLDLAAMGAAARIDVATRLSWASQATHLQIRLDELAARGPSLVTSGGRAHVPSRRLRPVVLRPNAGKSRPTCPVVAPYTAAVPVPERRPVTAQASATRSR